MIIVIKLLLYIQIFSFLMLNNTNAKKTTSCEIQNRNYELLFRLWSLKKNENYYNLPKTCAKLDFELRIGGKKKFIFNILISINLTIKLVKWGRCVTILNISDSFYFNKEK